MNLTRRGFLGAIVAVAVGAKAIVRGEPVPQSTLRPALNVRAAALPVEPGPYSIPAYLNEAGQNLADHPERWRYWDAGTTWTDNEIELNDWPSTRAHRGPRGKMRKAPRDSAYYEHLRHSGPYRQRDGHFYVLQECHKMSARGLGYLRNAQRWDEYRERWERLNRCTWAVPEPSKMA